MVEPGQGKISKKLEGAANVGIIVVALVALGIFAKNYWLKPPEPKHIAVGQQFGLKNANWQVSGRAIVLGISTTCHFCTESAPFYRELVQECAAQHVRTIAVLPESVDEGKGYLANEGISVNDVRQASLSELAISGTPTLLFVDNKGAVKAVWVGKLSPDREHEVLARIDSAD